MKFLQTMSYTWVVVWGSFAAFAIVAHSSRVFAIAGGMALFNLAIAQWLGWLGRTR